MAGTIMPHRGKELRLLLSGKKDIALFEGDVPRKGDIGQKRIPTRLFRPHVEKNELILSIRHYDFTALGLEGEGQRRFVLYARPEAISKVDDFYKLLENTQGKGETYHRLVGQMLGYSAEDIDAYIAEEAAA